MRFWAKRYGPYGWRGIKYFMFEYEQHLKSQTKTKRDKLTWEEFAKDDFDEEFSTVEHVYPQNSKDPCWKEPFSSFSVKERNVLLHSIGNLVPLSTPKNSSLGNKCFAEKKGHKQNKVGFAYGCYSEIEVAQEATWAAKEILDRGIRLLDFMEIRWKLTFGSREDKAKLLGLDFLLAKKQKPHQSRAA